MPEFSIYLSPEKVPQEIGFEGQEIPWKIAPIEALYFSAEADWLCLFALYTALGRLQLGEDDYCPCFTEINEKHAKKIAGAVYDDRNFSRKFQLEIPKDEFGEYEKNNSGEPDDRRHWLVKIFEVSPRKIYLIGSKSPGSERLRFTKDVTISVLKTTKGKLEKVEKVDELNEIFRSFERNLLGLEKNLYLKIKIEDPSSEEAPWQLIDSRECEGKLKYGVFYSIHATATYKTNFALFWIASSKEVWPLYPYHRFKESIQDEFSESNAKTTLKVGESCQFEVHPPEGTDLCVLLTREKSFTEGEFEVLESLIVKSLTSANLRGRLAKDARPILEKFSVAKKRRVENVGVSQTRFGVRKKAEQWKRELARSIGGKAVTLCIFSIPNKQS